MQKKAGRAGTISVAARSIPSLSTPHPPPAATVVTHSLPAASFEAAARFGLIKGFAVGRTIFHDVSREWLGGRTGDQEAVEQMATRFSNLVAAWRSARARLESAA